MDKGMIRIIYGLGGGKTTAAIGSGIRAIGDGKTVNMVQFLKGRTDKKVLDVLERLEPEMKIFRFEKHELCYGELDEEEKKEELDNIKNGMGFVRKIMSTNGCDVLILDEFLGLADSGIITEEELESIIKLKPGEMELILTGQRVSEKLKSYADVISHVEKEK